MKRNTIKATNVAFLPIIRHAHKPIPANVIIVPAIETSLADVSIAIPVDKYNRATSHA
ncbi:MAG: hypothetical protein ACKO0V_05260 [bacterium]